MRGKQDRFRRVSVYPRSLQRQQESQPGCLQRARSCSETYHRRLGSSALWAHGARQKRNIFRATFREVLGRSASQIPHDRLHRGNRQVNLSGIIHAIAGPTLSVGIASLSEAPSSSPVRTSGSHPGNIGSNPIGVTHRD